MHAVKLLHNLFKNSPINIHKVRLASLFAAVDSLLSGRQLTLTGLGQHMPSQALVKHSIKRSDRLLGNQKLQQESCTLYQVLAHHILKNNKRPILLIDWSQLGDNDKFYMISAAIPYGGRSLGIYHEVHRKSLCNTTPTNINFLKHLKAILPKDCKPIIVTDAGTTFRCPWFKHMETLRWDYVGRVRAGEKFCIKYGNNWSTCKKLYTLAQQKAASLGTCILTKRSQFACKLILATRTLKGRAGKGRNRKPDCGDRKSSRRIRDPWLLATSLSLEPDMIIAIYKQRMQIEELFRDLKNQRIGFALKKSMSGTRGRLEILLLIGMIANYAVFILGQAAKKLSLHYQFQSNTNKSRAVISVFNLGLQILCYRKTTIPISIKNKIFHQTHNLMIKLENLA